MPEEANEIKFTGEFFVPGQSGERIEADHMARYQFAARHARGKQVLDVACGVGYGSQVLMNAGALKYSGVDINPELVSHARKTYGAPGVDFQPGDVTALKFREEFDLITCFETIEHVEDYQQALASLFQALKPGGGILVSSPDRRVTSPSAKDLSSKPSNRYHVREFLPSELLEAVTRAGFVAREDGIYGQRIRSFRPRTLLGRVMRRVYNPEERFSPQPRPLNGKLARYFVIHAFKPAVDAEPQSRSHASSSADQA